LRIPLGIDHPVDILPPFLEDTFAFLDNVVEEQGVRITLSLQV
jgi:hypothetical protein